MKAAVRHTYGSPDVIRIEERPRREPGPDGVLVRVRAAALNPLDWHEMRGEPRVMRLRSGLRTPNEARLGVDVAGVVESVGEAVTRFAVGDEVFGSCRGAFAEYTVTSETDLVAKPAMVTFEQAAGVPVAGFTALQGLRDHGSLTAGQRVLVNGAAGGVGHLAVQLAKHFGAHVTAVCSTRNVELVRSLGADTVVDYTVEDFTEATTQYDLIFDLAANHSHRTLRRIATPKGVIAVAGASPRHPVLHMLASMVIGPFVSQKLPIYIASVRTSDLEYLATLLERGELRVEVSRTFALEELPEAIAHLEEGHARGKVVVTL